MWVKRGRQKKESLWVGELVSVTVAPHMVFVGRGRLTATVCSFNESVCAGQEKGLIKTLLSVISSFQPINTRILCVPACTTCTCAHTDVGQKEPL